MKFRKKPVVVEAEQFHYWRTVYGKWEMAWPTHGVRGAKTFREKLWDWWKGFPHYYTDTREGTLRVTNGDWIIKGVQGEYYPCKPDIFEATYERVEDATP